MSDVYPIAGLDMATSTGWAILDSPGAEIEYSSKIMHGGNDGVVGCSMQSWLEAFFSERKPSMVYAEDVFLRGGSTVRLLGLQMLLKMAASRHGVLTRFVQPRKLKKHFTGNGNADKERMMAEAFRRGFSAKNDDEADAIAILLFGLDVEDPGEAASRLFAA